MTDELQQQLDMLARDECYRVDAVLRESPAERTERVFFVGTSGAERGPFVRKTIKEGSGLGGAYERIFEAQRAGVRLACLPRIEECYELPGEHVVVMERVAGETLAQLVARKGPSPSLACEVMPKVCDAVAQLHAAFDPPIIHRDLKPENVMISASTPVLIDFGIARTYKEGSERDTRHFGTRAYAPPEQFGFGQTDVRSDVYALGMLLWFCLVGEDPDATSRVGGYAHPAIPEPLREVVSLAGALDPAVRYQSADEMARALRAAAERLREAGAEVGAGAGADAVGFGDARAAETALRADASRAAGEVSEANGSLLSRTDRLMGALRRFVGRKAVRRLGVAWDILLLLCAGLLTFGACNAVVNPLPGSPHAERSLAYVIAMTVIVLFLFIYPIAFLLADKRPIRKLVPALPPMTFKRHVAFALACFVLLFVGTVAVGML